MTGLSNNKYKICIIGRGNVGSHLAKAFKEAGCIVSVVNPRNLDGLSSNADIYIISVSDDAIESVALALNHALCNSENTTNHTFTVAHTSGGVGIGVLSKAFGQHSRVGVLYPMQTFSKDIEMNYTDIPFFIEGSDKTAEKFLSDAASLLSEDVSLADSSVRRDYHIAAVFACNFTNYLFNKAYEYLESKNLDFKKMLPLIDRTCRKIHTVAPAEAQTGPAKRHDHTVMQSHLQCLADKPELRDLYLILSRKIMLTDPDPEKS